GTARPPAAEIAAVPFERKKGYANATDGVKDSADLHCRSRIARAARRARFDGASDLPYVCAPMTDPAPDGSRAEANARAAEIARPYREQAPRAPETGLDLFEIFPPNSEIEMEIGFGRGQFLVQRSSAAPGSYLLGLEIKKKLAYQVAQRCARMRLGRVHVLSGDARAVLPLVRPAAAVARVFMHFPDPWWKKRHAKRRLFGDELIGQVAR